MPAPSAATVIIGCPNCGTRYRLPQETVGRGRLVKCATCATSWTAEPLEPEAGADELFDAEAEARLDAQFAAVEERAAEARSAQEQTTLDEIKRAIAPRPKPPKPADPAIARRQLKAFSQRQAHMRRRLPTGRFRSTVRIVAVTGLILLLTGGLLWRQAVVQQVPDLAGVYAAIGLPVNVVGLQFRDVQTLEMLSNGVPVLSVTGKIVSVSDAEAAVPPVVITLVSETGAAVYEWSVTPKARELEPGETVDFETRLTQPPQGAARVRLSFANTRAQPQAAAPIPNNGKGH